MRIGSLKLRQCFRAVFFMLVLVSVTGRMLASDETTPRALQKAADQTYDVLKRRDVDKLISMLSRDRFFRIALRKAVWTDKKLNAGETGPNDPFYHLLDDLSPYGWEERNMEFDVENSDRTKLKKALARFAEKVGDTMHDGVEATIHGMDQWDERELGPHAVGKLASNSYWYIYFRREGSRWKIWKLELAEH